MDECWMGRRGMGGVRKWTVGGWMERCMTSHPIRLVCDQALHLTRRHSLSAARDQGERWHDSRRLPRVLPAPPHSQRTSSLSKNRQRATFGAHPPAALRGSTPPPVASAAKGPHHTHFPILETGGGGGGVLASGCSPVQSWSPEDNGLHRMTGHSEGQYPTWDRASYENALTVKTRDLSHTTVACTSGYMGGERLCTSPTTL